METANFNIKYYGTADLYDKIACQWQISPFQQDL
jgi:hypothetical protein